jgi:hypothetical protein
MFLDAARDNFSRLPYWIEYGGKAYAFIDSENTYALPAKIDAARFARGRTTQRAEDSTAGPSCSPANARGRHYKSGTKDSDSYHLDQLAII